MYVLGSKKQKNLHDESFPKVIKKTTLLEGRHISFHENTYLLEGEKRIKYEYVKQSNSSMILATDGKLFYLVQEYRYPAERVFTQFPIETKEKNETFLGCAKRGLLEEIGFEARNWVKIGSFFTDPGLTNKQCYVFLAKGLIKKNPIESERLIICKLSQQEIEALIKDEKAEAWTIAAWQLFKQYRS